MDISSDEYKGQALTGNLNMFTSELRSERRKVVENLIESLETRYNDVQDNVLGATKLGSLQTWPVSFESSINY